MQKFQAVPKTVTKVRGNGDAGSRFDGRHNGGKTVVSTAPDLTLEIGVPSSQFQGCRLRKASARQSTPGEFTFAHAVPAEY